MMSTSRYVLMKKARLWPFISLKSLVSVYWHPCQPTALSRRNISKDHSLKDDDLKPTYDICPEFKSGGLGTEFVTPYLSKWFDCSQNDACKLLDTEMQFLRYRHVEWEDEVINLLKQHGLKSDVLLNNSWLLCYSVSTLRPRLDLITKIGLTPGTIPFLKLTTRQLKRVINQWSVDEKIEPPGAFKNRLEYLSYHLQCAEQDIASLTVKHCSIMTVSFTKLSTTLTILLKYGISLDDIKKNLDIFSKNIDQLQTRLVMAHKANIDQIKIWLLLCPQKTFENIIIKRHNTKQEMESTNTIKYLAERLQCSSDYVQCLFKRYPGLTSIRLAKMKTVLDFLYENEFTPDQVCLTPYILRANINTLERRLQQFTELGYRPVHLHSLCSTTEEYKRFIQQLNNTRSSEFNTHEVIQGLRIK